jgi:hypothetical protein
MGTAGIAIPPWAQWVKLFIWDLPGALCLPDYYKCQKKVKEQCACRGRWRTTCEFWGYDCCFEEWNQCRADFFRVKGDPVKERRNPC